MNKETKETNARVKDAKGNEFICPINALKDIDDATVGRYPGNISIADD